MYLCAKQNKEMSDDWTMNIDTIFDIYKAYSLTKISELNKQGLIAQYRQNEQLSQLNDELAKANLTSKLILRNQAKEIEQKENNTISRT